MPSPPNLLAALLRSDPVLVSTRPQTQANQPFPLARGEIVRALVLNVRPHAGLVTLAVKGQALEIKTAHSFRPGQTITLQVDRLEPNLQFRLAGGVGKRSPLPGALAGGIRLYPQSLLNLFADARTILQGEAMNALVRIVGKQDADRLLPLLKSLVFTGKSADRSFQLRDYLERVGLLMEQRLGNGVTRTWGQGAEVRAAADNLKAFLMSLESKLILSGERAPPSLLNFIGSSLKAIETWQALNSLLGDQERTFLFQVPLALAEEIRMAHILVSRDGDHEDGEPGKGGNISIVLFLDMDILGPLGVRADLASGAIDCVITCEEAESAALLDSFLGELRHCLEEANLTVGRIHCRQGHARFAEESVRHMLEVAAREYDRVDLTI